jgi:DUF917 family protein
MVGAPAAAEAFIAPDDWTRAVELLLAHLDRPLAGLITSENGGTGSVNGLLQSAALDIPVVDAPCDGRAHPTGVMGSMGLGAVSDYVSRQAAVGGNPELARRVQVYVEGPLAQADAIVRIAAVEAGGLVAVARNPVTAGCVREHGAPGAIAMAMQLGGILIAERPRGGRAVAERVAAELGGGVLAAGEVRAVELETRGGYDVGRAVVGDVELTLWNEYMTAERGGERLATFPDLIATLDLDDGTPVTSAELRRGRRVVVLAAPRDRLILGAGVRDPENLRAIERALGRPVVSYAAAG